MLVKFFWRSCEQVPLSGIRAARKLPLEMRSRAHDVGCGAARKAKSPPGIRRAANAIVYRNSIPHVSSFFRSREHDAVVARLFRGGGAAVWARKFSFG